MVGGNQKAEITPDLFGKATTSLPSITRRVVETGSAIMQDMPDRADFLHTILCQVGMPRRATPGRVFERSSGGASMLLEAGKLWTGRDWREVPLPYGTRPRLVMVHVSSEAIRTHSRQIPIGDSMKGFLITLGIDTNGGPRGGYTMFKRQMEALAACRLMLGFTGKSRAVTLDAKPISRFDAWLHPSGDQRSLWPGLLELSQEYFDTLSAHAVPLDHRALSALKHSALALDLYTWLAYRLCRVRRSSGVKLSWEGLREQFGQEYADPRNFKKEFRQALRPALAVYPDARVEEVAGGLILKSSRPPLPKTQIVVPRLVARR